MQKTPRMLKRTLVFSLFMLMSASMFAQLPKIDYEDPKTYEIGGITVSGIKYLDHNILIQLSGLTVGDSLEIPGEEITKAVDKLWDHGLFSDVEISATKVDGNKIYLDIYLQERPRLSKVIYKGISNSEAEDIQELVDLKRGSQVTDNILSTTKHLIKKHFKEEAYHNVEVDIIQKNDTSLQNVVMLYIDIKKGDKIRVNEINIEGNKVFTDNKVERFMKKTNEKALRNFFRTKKFKEEEYINDKKKIIEKYQEQGYRDIKIVEDSVYQHDEKTFNVYIKIEEGDKYYFRNITWVGNTKYTAEQLNKVLKIEKGDVYNQQLLEERLQIDEDAVSNLYLDNGYLFFNINPVEVAVENDSIDLEMRIYEGKQATVNLVRVSGNTQTKDHVVRREIRSLPGQLFRRSDITRTIRELAQLGYFDPEKLNVNPLPDPENGTVDLEYIVEERSNDQVEISGGWGANMIIGTIGLKFNNFAAGDIFKKGAWRPIPSGDGQQLSLRVQSNGVRYQNYSISFVEPWLGGKKPNSLSVSLYHSIQSNAYTKNTPDKRTMKISGVAVGLGRRLNWPDDYFTLYNDISFQQYNLNRWYENYFLITDGRSNNVSFETIFGRNSIDNPLYTRNGSKFTLSLQITPPYSLFQDRDWSNLDQQERYKWVEYHKWKFKGDWYTRLVDELVLRTNYEFGYLGYFTEQLRSPFEGFNLGGDGLTGFSMYGRETIALRGYANNSLTPRQGGNIYNKFTLELRYPFSLNPQATIYGLAFFEAGNAWYDFKDFNPFNLNRSLGVGVRIFLPMLGLMGIDWGYGFDPIPGRTSDDWGSQFHFVIGQQF